MKKVAFHNLGCKVNSYELDGIMQNFQKCGYEIVDFAQKADIYVVNTCTVTNIADRKSRQMLHKAKITNPDAVVIATGCYVQTDTVGAINDEAIDFVVGNNEKARLVDYVEEYLAHKEETNGEINISEDKTLSGKTVDDLSRETEYENFCITDTNEHTRAYIKIQDGCNQFCSYCAIPLARGRVRSRDVEDIIEEIKGLAANGYREVVLTGIHLSSYGLDLSYNAFTQNQDADNDALLNVIESIAKIEGIDRIRLGSLEPRLITEGFVKRLTAVEKVCPHFHLSLQSGCDAVLERMNRRYTTDEYRRKVQLLRQYYEHPAITTDVIVGFPMESEDEFAITQQYLNDIDLYETHIFKFSRRRGTVADKMEGQLTDKIKSNRSTVLMADANRRKLLFIQYYIGREVEILTEDIETINGKDYRVGYTKEYVKCAVDVSNIENCLVSGIPDRVEDGILIVK